MNGIEINGVSGTMGRDVELRFSQSGSPWATFSIAVREVTTVKGERQEQTHWLNCKIFGAQAENLAESSGKGHRVTVSGKFRQEKWTGNDGQERNTWTLYVDEVSASLRWAQAKVTKVASTGQGGGAGGGYSGGGQRSGGYNDGGFGGGSSNAPAAAGGFSQDADPFGPAADTSGPNPFDPQGDSPF